MAQTGYTPILIYSSSTAAAAPTVGSLTNSTLGSELAINITDGKLFYKDNANAIQVIGWKVVPTTAGGTGLTSFTANQVFYASSTSAIGQSSNLTFNGTTLTAAGLTTTGALQVDGNATLGNAATDTVQINGYVGQGGAATASTSYYIRGTATSSGTNTFGFNYNASAPTATTNVFYAFTAGMATDASSTITTATAYNVSNLSKGAGATVTDFHGVDVADLTAGTNNYGIRLRLSSGANKWNVYAGGTAANYFAGQAQFANGSVGTPSISNINDTNTGIFFPAADTIAFTEGGVESMRLDSAGNVGIGVTPAAWGGTGKYVQFGGFAAIGGNSAATTIYGNSYFDGTNIIYGTSSFALYYQQNIGSGQHRWGNAAAGTAGNTVTFTQTMTLDPSGYLGVGVTSPAARLHLGGAITASSWTTNGIGLRYAAATYTDSSTAVSGTVASSGIHAFAQPTIAASNATVTYTNAATVYVANAPANGTNVTVTNPLSLWVDNGTTRLDGNITYGGLQATQAAAPTVASAATIAPITPIVFISGTTAIATITAPTPISSGGGQITLIPTGLWTTNTTGNIALASTAVVSRALIMTYDVTTAKWYPSY